MFKSWKFYYICVCGKTRKNINEFWLGVVGWCEGVVYLSSPGHPTDIGLQFGKACYPCIEGGCFISSVSSLSFLFLFLPCSSLSSPLLSLFSLSLGDDTK